MGEGGREGRRESYLSKAFDSSRIMPLPFFLFFSFLTAVEFSKG